MSDSDSQPPAPAQHLIPAFTPVPRLKERSNGWKPEVQRAFIEALADTGSVSHACKRVGRSTHGAYALRRSPGAEEFAAACAAAVDHCITRLEDIAPFLCAMRPGRTESGTAPSTGWRRRSIA